MANSVSDARVHDRTHTHTHSRTSATPKGGEREAAADLHHWRNVYSHASGDCFVHSSFMRFRSAGSLALRPSIESTPISSNPLQNSSLVNSHMYSAFMRYEITSCTSRREAKDSDSGKECQQWEHSRVTEGRTIYVWCVIERVCKRRLQVGRGVRDIDKH